MTEPESISLLEALIEHQDLHSAVFFTYGADFAFFEEAVLHPLWQNGCRHNLVFMDAVRYADTIDDLGGSVTWPGRRYIPIPVPLGSLQSFHPKMILLLGGERGRLLIGSGNLTFTGFGDNYEVFTSLDWTPDQPSLQHLFVRLWNLVKTVLEKWGHSDEARKTIRKVEYRANWLTTSTESTPQVRLLHTLDEPLIDQCVRALNGETVRRLTVLTPFIDDSARALRELYQRFRPEELQLVVQDQQVVGNVETLQKLEDEGLPLTVYRFSDDERYLHAKVYVFEALETSYALTGSANCTGAAWLNSCAAGNLELMLLRRGDSPQHFESLLEDRVAPRPISSLQDLNFREKRLPPSLEEKAVRLLDVSVEASQLSVHFSVAATPEEVSKLQLQFSPTPSYSISLGVCERGPHRAEMRVPEELQGRLTHPVSATIWGVTANGESIDLGCNKLWVTNVDVLRREISQVAPVDVRTGGYISDMVLESEDEWADLYQSLVRLVELDVSGLRRRGGTYTTSPSTKSSSTRRDSEESEM